MWVSELGFYYYKARMYSPTLGRFLQTDPIGYGDGLNWYNYVGGDPVNFTDPSGLGAITIYGCPTNKILSGTGAGSPPICIDRVDVDDWLKRIQNQQPSFYPPIDGVGALPSADTPQSNNSGSVLESRGKKMSEAEREKAREADYKICRVVNTRACWASAAERDAARATGRPVPPLQTGVRDNWSGRDLLRGAGAAAIVGGVICVLAEPCGAAVLGGLTIGGGAIILAN